MQHDQDKLAAVLQHHAQGVGGGALMIEGHVKTSSQEEGEVRGGGNGGYIRGKLMSGDPGAMPQGIMMGATLSSRAKYPLSGGS